MADETSTQETMSRNDLAEYLRDLAAELEGEDEANVSMGNKTVTLHPAPEVDCEVTISERSPTLGSDSETIRIDMNCRRRSKVEPGENVADNR